MNLGAHYMWSNLSLEEADPGGRGGGSSVAKVSLLTERGNSCEKTHKILVRSSLHLQILRNTTRIYET